MKMRLRVWVSVVSVLVWTACTAGPTTVPQATVVATTAPQATVPPTSVPRETVLATTSGPQATAVPPTAAPVGGCAGPLELTHAQTEGPYYTPNTPERTSLRADGPGTPLLITGRVLTQDCEPQAGAFLDFWHANDNGEYDNSGYAFRGHQFTDAEGFYRLETIWPGLYPGRTRHIHVKVQATGGPMLTSQIYFPDEPQNTSDGLFDAALLITWRPAGQTEAAIIDFVVEAP